MSARVSRGFCAGYHLQTQCPNRRYAILEGRSQIGGTWDLFRYPGIRSDSDMFTMGYSFRAWKEAKALADGPSILSYVKETAPQFGIDRQIRFQHRVRSAAWSSEESLVDPRGGSGTRQHPVRYTCGFLYLCSGYYDYQGGHAPRFVGSEDFQGRVIHPQHWPADLDYRDKRVVVIGSGATAGHTGPRHGQTGCPCDHAPTLADLHCLAAGKRPDCQGVRRLLPERAAHRVVRWKNVLLTMFFFQLCRRAPLLAKRMFRRGSSASCRPA